MAEWRVRHKEHDGTIIDEFRPLNLTFNLVIDAPDDITYDVSLAEPTMRWFLMGPKRTDWELVRDGQVITAGIHSFSGSKRGSELVNCQGKSWLWYLQGRHWPIYPPHVTDFVDDSATGMGGFAYMASQKTPGTIINDMLTTILARPNSLAITHGGLDAGGPPINFRIPLGDTEMVYDKILQLSSMGTDGEGNVGGFNFDVLPNKQFVIYHPQRFPDAARSDPSACIHIFDDLTPPTEIVDIEFQNLGPDMTHIYGDGPGFGTVENNAYAFSPGGVQGGSDQTQQIFRRWDGTISFTDVFSGIFSGTPAQQKRLYSLVQMHYSAAMYPQISLPITVKPEAIANFWTVFQPGKAVWVNIDFEVRRVQQAFKINQITGRVDSEGNELADLDLEQIMPQGNPGVAHG